MFANKWKLEAKCFNDENLQEILHAKRAGTGYDPFFDKPETRNSEWAKKYCSDCPVRLACLAEAMKTLSPEYSQFDQLAGIWGGMTHRRRVALKNKQLKQIQQISMQLMGQSPDADENRIA